MIRRRDIIGTAVSITDYDEVLAAIDLAVTEDQRIFICCTPASSLIFARDDRRLADALAAADIVTPDGMGVVHAARLLGEEIADRVYGPDLMELQLTRACSSGTPIFLYGGHDEAALAELRATLLTAHPGLQIVGGISPPHREPTEGETSSTVDAINASGAKIVWVGLGSPKQEIWMHQLRTQLEAPVLIGVGAAFDFAIGRVNQAPGWMQRSSLEWFYRLLQDPVRLGRRYLVTLPRFAFLALRQVARERRLR